MHKMKIILTVILISTFAYLKPAFAQNEIQQLNQKIDVLQDRIAQLQAKINSDPVPVTSPLMTPGWGWDPFFQMEDMQQHMNSLMNQLPINVAKVDMQETPGQYLITMNIPGMDKKDISVELKDRTLVISGKNSQISTQKGIESVNKESSYGYFMQSVVLPQNSELDKISSQYRDGTLTVSVPLGKQGGHNANVQKITVQ